LIDRRNFHLFQPLLYQVATGSLSPGEIATPLRAVLRRQANARVLLGTVTDVDLNARNLHVDPMLTGASAGISYDTLVVATGARHARILGSITPGERPLVLPVPAASAPTRIEFRSTFAGNAESRSGKNQVRP